MTAKTNTHINVFLEHERYALNLLLFGEIGSVHDGWVDEGDIAYTFLVGSVLNQKRNVSYILSFFGRNVEQTRNILLGFVLSSRIRIFLAELRQIRHPYLFIQESLV